MKKNAPRKKDTLGFSYACRLSFVSHVVVEMVIGAGTTSKLVIIFVNNSFCNTKRCRVVPVINKMNVLLLNGCTKCIKICRSLSRKPGVNVVNVTVHIKLLLLFILFISLLLLFHNLTLTSIGAAYAPNLPCCEKTVFNNKSYISDFVICDNNFNLLLILLSIICIKTDSGYNGSRVSKLLLLVVLNNGYGE